ncbi:hypothetical protein BHE74_00002550 [Ensete ventricosum]|nr:hypothetical protein GW17_00035328 [Ensete ventricosum]RWW88571.1 hypothetical protein BHE74_00002550 [Ensete ventricosum]RZR76796.1 hypothetical protein BHM03_00001678 [Ensete ventricosum]
MPELHLATSSIPELCLASSPMPKLCLVASPMPELHLATNPMLELRLATSPMPELHLMANPMHKVPKMRGQRGCDRLVRPPNNLSEVFVMGVRPLLPGCFTVDFPGNSLPEIDGGGEGQSRFRGRPHTTVEEGEGRSRRNSGRPWPSRVMHFGEGKADR